MMKTLMVRISVMTVVSFGLLACGKNFEAKDFGAPLLKPAEILKVRDVGPSSPNAFSLDTGKVKEEPIVYSDGVNTVPSAYKQIHGRLQVDNFKFQFDKKTQDMAISGDLNFGLTPDAKPLAFSMHGKMLPNKSTYMSIGEVSSPLAEVLKAKITCVNDACEDFFVDFAYKVEKEKSFYVLRISNITPKEEVIENFPVQEPVSKVETPKVEAPKVSPKNEPVQGQGSKTPVKSVTTAPAPKTSKAAPVPKKPVANKAVSLVKPNSSGSIIVRLRSLLPTRTAPVKSNQVSTGRIRKAGEPKVQKNKQLNVGVIRKAGAPQPVSGTKLNPDPQGLPVGKVDDSKIPPVAVVEEMGGTDDLAIEEAETRAAIDLADTDLNPGDIIEMFPELKDEKGKADQALAEKRDKGATPIPPILMSPGSFKALGGIKNLSPSVLEVLAALPPGVNQAVQVAAKTKARIQRRLQNGVNLIPLVQRLNPHSGLRILHPEQNNFWGTTELVATVIRIGQWVTDNVGDVQLDVADLSDQNGGVQVHAGTNKRTHLSHQYGIDVDLGYVIASHNDGGRMRVPSMKSDEFLIDKQWDLFRDLFKEDIAHQIYVSASVKKALCQHLKQTHELEDPQIVKYSNRIAVVAGHENHFHLRIKCGPDQKLCGPEIAVRPSPCR